MSPSLLQTAMLYMDLRKLLSEVGNNKMLYHKKSFWIYKNRKWIKHYSSDIFNDIISLAKADPTFLTDTSEYKVKNIVKNLQAICSVDNLEFGTFIGVEKSANDNFIPLQNGILRIRRMQNKIEYVLLPHTHEFFSPYILPYEYNPDAKGKIFLDLLSEILEPDQVKLLRQWFGYCLIPVTLAEKFFIAHGGGSNGKSVILILLALLVGEENVSRVLLQGFVADSDFTAADTVNKLINIVHEVDEMDAIPTGFLKEFVSGEQMRCNEKFKPAYLFKPTARLMFSTNKIPMFKDNSYGFLKRLIILEFPKQFVGAQKDTRFKRADFWISSGELPAIFNWALEGLNELIMNDWEFDIPESVNKAIESFKESVEPALEFLKDNIEASPGSEMTANELYKSYKSYCAMYGYNKATAREFSKTVRKAFPQAVRTENAHVRRGVRSRLWLNIRFIQNNPSESQALTPQTPETQTISSELINTHSEIQSEEVLRASIKAS